MTGTPSRTATAYDGGTTRYFVVADATTPRGYVGRKQQQIYPPKGKTYKSANLRVAALRF